MAKKFGFDQAPWIMSRKEFEKFKAITEANRKNAVMQGRIIYSISDMGKVITYLGCRVIDPCFTKGNWRVQHKPFVKGTHSSFFEVFFREDMNRSHWASSWDAILKEGIEKKQLYINPSDPILKYFKL